ncbi:MAG: hypothetical protein EOP89_12690, partial [Lysobacteraceae bacterium]
LRRVEQRELFEVRRIRQRHVLVGDAPVLRVANEDVPLPYAANLEKLALVDAAKVVKAVKKVTYKG